MTCTHCIVCGAVRPAPCVEDGHMPTEREPVESSNVAAIGATNVGRLYVEFKGGVVWAYDLDVPMHIAFRETLATPDVSVGRVIGAIKQAATKATKVRG